MQYTYEVNGQSGVAMSKKSRYTSYKEWLGKGDIEGQLKKGLEKSGVPLELRAMKVLLENEYQCSSFRYLDTETRKYRDIDIIASKTHKLSFNIDGCNVVFNITILGECKHSYNLDFLAFETKDRHFPTFPVVFTGKSMLGASYREFVFPLVIRKIAETDVSFNLKWQDNFQDKKTHKACEKLTSCFSYLYDRRLKRTRVDFDQYRLLFGKSWGEFLSKGHSVREKQILQRKIGEFAEANKQLISQIHYFPIEIGFPLMIIDENRGLIKIEYDEENASIKNFKDVGYGIYPYVSEFADRYDNILGQYFAFPIVICNLAYLKACIETLNNGLEKMIDYAKKLLHNNPHAIIEEICERIFTYEKE